MGMAIPDKKYFRIGEVSRLTGLEAHVIRYWEKEFPRLKPVRAGSRQRLYSREDIALIQQIRRLVHEERYTIAGARKKLAGPAPLQPAPPETPPPLPDPPLSKADKIRAGSQLDLPLFAQESPPPSQSPEGTGQSRLLGEIKRELGQIIRILS